MGNAITRVTRPAAVGGLVLILWAASVRPAAAAEPWWSAAVETRLGEAGDNRAELELLLNEAPADHRDGAAFLIEHMPTKDLETLSAAFLLENLNLAYEAWQASPWQDAVSADLFLNDVLPYACLTEARDPWRAKLRELCAPLVAECKTPGEAALVLNREVFPRLKVRYDTARRRPDQSPSETIDSGIATCTGLSILLVDACRSVGVPVRVAGTPLWTNMRGNHTWVEVWDGGDWHFVGAAEPDDAGLDHGWFLHDASQAQRDVPRHAIYASSFRQTDVAFPLVWARRNNAVPAVNVTDSYAAQTAAPAGANVRLAVKVVDANGQRAVADVLVTDLTGGAAPLKDQSRGETADLNNLATFALNASRKYHVEARLGNRSAATDVEVTDEPEQLVTLVLAEQTAQIEVCPVPADAEAGAVGAKAE